MLLRDDGLRSEAAERLRQFAAERAAADDQQAARQLGQVEDVLVGQIAGLDEPGNRGRVRPRAGGDQRLLEAQLRAVHRQRIGAGEARLAEEHIHAGRVQPVHRIDAADAGANRRACAASPQGNRRGYRPGPARRTARQCASRHTAATVRMIAFDGTQPTFRQSPPSRSRSISATFAPSAAAACAATSPAVPAPTTTRLYRSAGCGLRHPDGRTLSSRSRSYASRGSVEDGRCAASAS